MNQHWIINFFTRQKRAKLFIFLPVCCLMRVDELQWRNDVASLFWALGPRRPVYIYSDCIYRLSWWWALSRFVHIQRMVFTRKERNLGIRVPSYTWWKLLQSWIFVFLQYRSRQFSNQRTVALQSLLSTIKCQHLIADMPLQTKTKLCSFIYLEVKQSYCHWHVCFAWPGNQQPLVSGVYAIVSVFL